MSTPPQSGDEQARRWNGPAGHAWVQAQELLDRVFKPLEELLVEAVRSACGRQVLDVGCGTGTTTLAAARLLGANGKCTGIDISDPVIAAARKRAELEGTPADFILADAQHHAFEPASFDTIISRFGVMFFSDFVQAFANLRRAAREGAEARLIAWRSAAENPFMTAAERAAAPLLPDLPVRRPDEPGQFAFGDANRVRRILEQSGWTQIDLQPIDFECTLPETELVGYLSRLGPVGLYLQQADEQTRKRVMDVVRPAFDLYVRGGEVRFNAACWLISARAASTATEGTANG